MKSHPPPRRRARRLAQAVERVESTKKSWRRLIRTLVLGTVATVLALIWIADQYGIEREVILSFLGTSTLFVLVLVMLGLVGAGILLAVKRLRATPPAD